MREERYYKGKVLVSVHTKSRLNWLVETLEAGEISGEIVPAGHFFTTYFRLLYKNPRKPPKKRPRHKEVCLSDKRTGSMPEMSKRKHAIRPKAD